MPVIQGIIQGAKRVFGIGSTVTTETNIEHNILDGKGLTRPVTKELIEFDKIALSQDRKTKIAFCQNMALSDTRVRRIFNKLSSDASVGGFSSRVEVAPNEADKVLSQKVINNTVSRCKLKRKMKGWMKSCLRDGDFFGEIIVNDETGEIIRIKKLAASITCSTMDEMGNFPDPEKAYYQEHPFTREHIRDFAAWQIVHIKWEEEDGAPYGEPIFSSTRKTYNRLDSAEKNISIRRAMTSGRRLQHKIGSADKPDWQLVDKYKEMNKDTLDHPLDPAQDYFTTGNIEIVEIGGDSTLGDLRDVEFFEGLIPMAAGIPVALLGGGRESVVNRDVLNEQEEDYYRVIQDLIDTFEYGLEQVFNFALLLAGINDEAIKYEFIWGARDRDDIDSKITRAEKLLNMGWSWETVHAKAEVDELSYEEELDRIKKQKEENVIPYGIGMKMDTIMAQIQALIASNKGSTGNEELSKQLAKLADLYEQSGHPSATIRNIMSINQ